MKSKAKSTAPAVSAARAAAFDILLRVERELSYASELLHSRTYNQLSTVDHALMTELVMGVLRWRSLLDSRIAASSAQPLGKLDLEIVVALRLAIYQLGWLSRVPARAAIHESVELVKRARKRSAASFVNAVLRNVAGKGAGLGLSQLALGELHSAGTVDDLVASSSHPAWLVERWIQAYGIERARLICEYDQSAPVTAIRMRGPAVEEQLKAEGIELAPGALLSSARRIVRGDISASAAFRAGMVVVQDEASQLVAAMVGTGVTILDCCAAPGGKTAAMADRNFAAAITAVELHPHRARLLRKLLTARISNETETRKINVITADARHLPFAATFDRVLADVPCSGTGTLARNPEIKWRLTTADLADLQSRQIAILRSAMAQAAKGARVIYSTCSLEKEENEDVVEALMSENRSFRVVECEGELDRLKREGELLWNEPVGLTSGPYLRTIPGIQPCDGFFAAVLEKM